LSVPLSEHASLINGMDYKIRNATANDLARIKKLLVTVGLPTAGIEDNGIYFLVVLGNNSEILAVIGMERFGDKGLLRSLACDPEFRQRGIATELVKVALAEGRKQGIKCLYLMTQTAENYLKEFGFKTIERQEIPEDLLKQSALNAACPACSTCMSIVLE